jgi:hypothetical protein
VYAGARSVERSENCSNYTVLATSDDNPACIDYSYRNVARVGAGGVYPIEVYAGRDTDMTQGVSTTLTYVITVGLDVTDHPPLQSF